MVEINKGVVAVKFEATWCGPCKAVGKMLIKMQSENPEMNVQVVDIEEDPQAAKEYKIRNLPTVILFREGIEVKRFVGQLKSEEFKKAYQDLVNDRAA